MCSSDLGQQYFAGPQEPRDLGMEWDSRIKKKAARDKIKRSIRKEDDKEKRIL